MRRTLMTLVLVVLVALVGGVVFAGWRIVEDNSTHYPSTDLMEPLPPGYSIRYNATAPPGGSDNWGIRLILVSLPKGVSSQAGVAKITQTLRARGWSRLLCPPSGDPCALIDATGPTTVRDARESGLDGRGLSSLSSAIRSSRRQTVFISLAEV